MEERELEEIIEKAWRLANYYMDPKSKHANESLGIHYTTVAEVLETVVNDNDPTKFYRGTIYDINAIDEQIKLYCAQ